MKKIILTLLSALSLVAFISCASTKEADAAPQGDSPARKLALSEEGAIDLSTWETVDKFAAKYNAQDYTLTFNGGEYFQFRLPQELDVGQTIRVHVTGTNNGKSGFRSWTVDDNQTTNANVVTDYAFDALPQGDFDVTYTLTTTGPSTYVFFKGPQYGTMIEKLVFKSLSVIYE